MDTLSFWPVSSIPYDQEQQHPHQQQQHHHHQQQQQQQQHHPHSALRPQAVGETMISSATSSEPSPPIPQTPYSADHGYLKREWEEDQPEEKVPEASSENQMQDELLDGELGEADERPLRRKRRVKGQRICGVCGDLAQSHNFGALTCETCKAFFRRNAFKQKELQNCVFNSSCTITKSTRRFCAPCRLKKCFAIGMDPDLILGEEEKLERHRKRTQGKATRQEKASPSGELNHDAAHSTTPAFSSLPSSPASLQCSSSSSTNGEPAKGHGLGAPDSNVGSSAGGVKEEGTPECSFANPSPCNCRSSRAMGLGFLHAVDQDLPKEAKLYWTLSAHEREKLDQLTTTLMEIMRPPWEESGAAVLQPPSLSTEEISVDKVMLAIDIVLRKFVKFSKIVPEFCLLQQQDQITLLKSAAMRFYCLRLAHSYIPHRRTWVTGVGEMSEPAARVLFKDKNLPVLLNTIIHFCEGVEFVFQGNPTLYALLKVLVLFDPRDQNLSDTALVNTLKDHYLLLLKHFLEARFSFTHANRYLTEMMHIYEDLDALGRDFVNFFTIYTAQMHPLIAEFLSF